MTMTGQLVSARRTVLVRLSLLAALGASATLAARHAPAAASLVAFVAPAQDTAAALPPDEVKRFEAAWRQQPRVTLGVPAGTARVVVVKFNDWLCSGCKGMHEVYAPIFARYEKEHPGAVKYVVRDWPWNTGCNSGAGRTLPGHEASCEAAVAVRLARDRGKAAEDAMIAWLFDNQLELNRLGSIGPGAAARIKEKAGTLLGLKPGEFDQEFPLRVQQIRRDVAEGMAVHIQVTPTFYVNGIKTTAPVTPDGQGGNNLPAAYFDLAIRLELERTGG
jgi:protein-disulfide isomerase